MRGKRILETVYILLLVHQVLLFIHLNQEIENKCKGKEYLDECV